MICVSGFDPKRTALLVFPRRAQVIDTGTLRARLGP